MLLLTVATGDYSNLLQPCIHEGTKTWRAYTKNTGKLVKYVGSTFRTIKQSNFGFKTMRVQVSMVG